LGQNSHAASKGIGQLELKPNLASSDVSGKRQDMENLSINNLLERRGAWFKGEEPDYALALARQDITRAIAADYPSFEKVRDTLQRTAEALSRKLEVPEEVFTSDQKYLLELLQKHELASRNSKGDFIPLDDPDVRRYMSGIWLEELAWLAATEAGADEAVFGQVLGWNVKGFSGENEIDLIARRNKHLCFISCKALRSFLDIQDRKHRNRLMDAVHEADNLIDHFGQSGDRVAVLVTTDLFDELRGTVRYNALMGKAAVLDVRIIALEDLSWARLVAVLGEMWKEAEQAP
jgi:Domain of unknown function (DUF1887)